jgi:hypothetical protein
MSQKPTQNQSPQVNARGNSREVRAGSPRTGGEVWAIRKAGTDRVDVGVFYLTGLAVEVDMDVIAEFRDGLSELLREAGRE